MAIGGTAISFDGNDLQTDNIIVNDIDHHSGPSKNAQMYGIAHANYSAIPFLNYPSKTITIQGTLKVDDGQGISDMDTLIDTFKSYFIGKDKDLDIGYGGSTRRYICTPDSPQISRPGGLTYVTFTVAFNATYPFGQDTMLTTALNPTGRTLGVYSDGYTFIGSAPYQWPVITATYTAITGGTSKSVNIGNAATSQQITVTRTWIASDILQVDIRNRLVTVNGSLVDFTGGFPEFGPGAQAISYSDSLSTRTFNYNVVYYPQWL